MKSRHKTLDILEYISLCNGERVTLCEAAGELKITPAAGTRIMGELVRRSYVRVLNVII